MEVSIEQTMRRSRVVLAQLVVHRLYAADLTKLAQRGARKPPRTMSVVRVHLRRRRGLVLGVSRGR